MKLEQHIEHDVSEYKPHITNELIRFHLLSMFVLTEPIEVNSLHHQIINIESVRKRKDCIASSLSNVYNTVESLEYLDYPAITVQWHPELIDDKHSKKAINYLLNC